jgi:general secretion pathway protein D
MKFNFACVLAVGTLLPLSASSLFAADSAASTQPMTASQAAHAESVKRQQLIISANQAISDGQRFLGSGNYDQAAQRFQYAVDALSPGGVSAMSYQRAEAGLAAAKAGQAQQAAKDTKFAQAASLLQESITLQPDNPVYQADLDELKKEQMAYEAQVRDPEGTTYNPAVTDDFKDRVATVQKLIFQGDAYFRTGQFDKSEETYSKALIIDPYNKAARDKMDHIEHYRERADGFRHEEHEQKQMEVVDHEWAESISPDIVGTPNTQGAVAGPSNRAAITRKLQSIIIDKVNFEKLDIGSVIQFLQQKSKELDPDHQGINFVLRLTANTPPPADTSATGPAPAPAAGAAPAAAPDTNVIHREVSITLENTPLADILEYIIQQTNLQYSVEDYAVYLRPSIDEGETLTVRTYLVPPNFFPGSTLRVTSTASTDQEPSSVSDVIVPVQQALTDKGIRFPAGATATFLPGSSKLVVRDTPEQLDLIANLIEQLSKETPQVQIEAKIAEFTQDAIKGLSFNYNFGFGIPGATGAAFNVRTALRTSNYAAAAGNGGLSPNSINSLILQNTGGTFISEYPIQAATGPTVAPNTPNELTIGGIVDGQGFEAIIDAINNMTGVSLLSAPSVTITPRWIMTMEPAP